MQQKATKRKESKPAIEASGLKPNQLKALYALVSGETKSQAARVAKVDRGTLYQWIEDPKFLAEYNRCRAEIGAAAAEELRSLSLLAAETIRDILQSPDESSGIKLRAALAVLERLPAPGPIGPTDPKACEPESKLAKDLREFYEQAGRPGPDWRKHL